MNSEEVIEQVSQRLEGKGSHVSFEKALEKIPYAALGEPVEGVPYTIWQLVEHMRLSLHEIVEYTKDPTYEGPPWPEGYWPNEQAPASEKVWREAVAQLFSARDEMIALLEGDPTRLLPGTKHSVLREALIAATHLSYHTGELVLMRRVLGCWKK